MSDAYFNVLMNIIEEITFQINSFTFKFCSVEVTYVIVGNCIKMNSIIYLKYFIGVFNQTLSIYDQARVARLIACRLAQGKFG